jgi:CSLREA domain-containing protein
MSGTGRYIHATTTSGSKIPQRTSGTVAANYDFANSSVFENQSGNAASFDATPAYGSYTLNKSGTQTANQNLTINGNVSVVSGTLNVTDSGTNTFTIGGAVAISSGAVLQATSSGGVGTLNITGSVTGAGTLTGNAAAGGTAFITVGGDLTSLISLGTGATNLTFSGGTTPVSFTPANGSTPTVQAVTVGNGTNAKTVNLGANLSVALGKTFSVANAGTLNCATGVISGGGNFTLVGGSTLGIGDPNGITDTDTTATGGNIRVSGSRTFNSTANYTYNGSVAQVTGNGLPDFLGGSTTLTINNSAGGVTLSQAFSTNLLTLTNGTFTTGSNLTLAAATVTRAAGGFNASDTLTITGNLNLTYIGSTPVTTGPERPASGNINVLSVSNTAGVTLGGNLTTGSISSAVAASGILNTGVFTFQNAAAFTNNGTINVDSGGTFSAAGGFTNSGTLNVNGSFQINGGLTLTGNNYVYGASSTLVFNSSGVTVSGTPVFWPTTNGPPNVTVQGSAGISMSIARTVSGLFQYSNTVVGANNLTLNGTSQVNSGGTMTGAPTYGASAVLKYNVNGSYNRNNEWTPNAASGNGYPTNVQLSNNTNLNLSSSAATFHLAGNLTVDSGSTMTLNSGNISVKGNVANSGSYTAGAQTLTFSGGAAQTWTDSTGAQNFGAVVINNSSTGVTLNSAISAAALTLTLGNVTTSSSFLLTVTGTASNAVSNGSASSYVNGPLARNLPASLASGSTYSFPVGKGGYNPFEMVNPTTSGTATIRAEVFDANSGGTAGTGLLSLNTNRYWQGAVTSGALTNTTVRLTDSSVAATSKIGKSETTPPGGTYNSIGGAVAGSTITSDPITSFSFFDIGTGANSISGQVLTTGGLTGIGAGRTINLLKNGTLAGSGLTDPSGNYSIPGLTLTSGDQLAVYISGALTEKGATITLSGSGDIINLNIWQNSLIVRSDNGGAITNDNLRTAGGLSPDTDLTAVRGVDGSNVLTVPASVSLLIWLNTIYAPGADINDGGDWINNGTFTAGTNTVTFNGTNNQTIKGLQSTTFNNLTIWNTGNPSTPANIVSMDSSLGATSAQAARLEVKTGVFDQGIDSASVDLLINGIGQCVLVRPSATWRNRGRGDETLSCGVLNEGTIDFNGRGTSCPDPDDIQIRSSEFGTQRTWEGTGTFSMTDVDVRDQKVPGGVALPLQILVNSGTGVAQNNTGWTFLNTPANCGGPYTWIGGVGQQWGNAANWSPSRTNALTSDVLIFDGAVTPAPVVEDVPNETDSAIRLQNSVNSANGVDVTLHANLLGSATLTLAGATGNDLDVPAGSRLTLATPTGSRPLVIRLTASTVGGTVHQGHVAGQIIMKDDKHQLIGDNLGEIVFNGANALTIDSSYPITEHPFGNGQNGSIVFQSPAVAVFSGGLDPFGGVGHSVVTFESGTTAHFFSAPAFFGNGGTYGHLILDGNNQSYFLAGSSETTVLNNFTLGVGNTFVLSSDAGGDMNLFGNFRDETIVSNGFQANGRTIKFQGATQTIFNAGILGTFSDVSIAQTTGGKVQLLSPTRITGQLTLTAADSLLDLNQKSLELDGTITGPGNLKGDSIASMVVGFGNAGDLGTVNFASDGRTLSSLQLNRSSNGSMTLGTDLALTGNLTLTDGRLNTGANTLSLSPASSALHSNGYVIGNLQKNFGSLGSFTFPLGTANAYSPLDVNVTANTAGALTATAFQVKQPNIPGANALKRYWTLNSSGSLTANLTFHYSTSPINDVVGNEANYQIFKYESGSFTPFTPDATGSPSASDHYATVNNISSFSDWTLAEPTALTPGTISFASAPYSTAEGNADHDVTITVSRSGGSDGAVSVNYSVTDGTATIADNDYSVSPASGTFNWANGDTSDRTITINVKGDTVVEPDQTVNLALDTATGGATIGTPATTLTITNDDADTSVGLVSGNLVISDAGGDNTDDTLTISLSGSNVRIIDLNHTLGCGAGVSVNAHTCDVPFSSISITGNIQVNTLGGNDSLTLALGGGNFFPAGGVIYNGGDPTTGPGDELFISGNNQGTVTYNYTNASDGNIVMSNFGKVTYTGLEPISNSGTATDVIFNLPTAANVATLSDLSLGSSRLASTGTFELTDFVNPSGSVTINGGADNDSISVGALAANYPSLTINGNEGNDTVDFTGNTTFAAAASLDVNLQDDPTPGIDRVFVNGQLTVSAAGKIDIRASQDVTVNSGGKLQVEDGSLTIEGNQPAISNATNHHGVEINGGTIQSTGTGNISVKGQGGEGASFSEMYGVYVWTGGKILSTGTGTITVEGTGGARTGGGLVGSQMYGVYVYLPGSEISSTSAAMTIKGFGGATNDTGSYGVVVGGGKIQQGGAGLLTINGTGGTCTGGNANTANSIGVAVTPDDTATPAAGVITSTGAAPNAGSISITGVAGNGGNGGSQGVRVDGPGTVTTVDGPLTINGTGATGGNSSLGVSIRGAVTASGTGAIGITGTGANSTAGAPTHGVNVRGGGVVSAFNGNITITGTGGNGTDNAGFDLAPAGNGTLQTTGTGNIIINADRIRITTTAAATIDAGPNAVSIRPKTATTSIDLGSITDTAASLELGDLELDRITCGTLNLGDNNSGAITVSSNITRTASTTMSLTSGSDIVISGGQVNTGGGTLLLDCGNSPAAVKPTKSLTDVTASTLSFGSDLAIAINGPTVDTQYDQLNVAGIVDITGVKLVLSGGPPSAGQFIIVNNDGADAIIGKFILGGGGTDANGGSLEEGDTITNFLGSPLNATITYQGDSGSNDVVLTVFATNANPTIAATTGLTRQQGSPSSNSQIATVNDAESGANGVTVTVNGGSSATVNGVTVSVIVNSNGNVTADVAAACNATDASFTLTANDGQGGTNTATLTITVAANDPPALGYSSPQTVAAGGSLTVNPAAGPGDNGSVSTIVVQSTGTYTGGISADNSTGAVSITNAAPIGSHTITIRATDNCAVFTDAQFTLDVTPVCASGPLFVNDTGDGSDAYPGDGICETGTSNGICTLRAAIQEANAESSCPGPITINFGITGSGVQTISPASPLPAVSVPVIIDGYTQGTATPNTKTDNTDDAVILIELTGANAGANADGIVLSGGNSTVEGLIINRFTGAGVKLTGAGTNNVTGNFIGTDATGLLSADGSSVPYGNFVGVLIDNIGNNMIGCDTEDERNVIAGNADDGVNIVGTGSGASLNLVWGNLIGINAAGAALGNGAAGVAIYDASDNSVGKDINGDGRGNFIGYNGGSGVEVKTIMVGPPPAANGNIISQNSIHDNGTTPNPALGIDLGGDGPTPNDSLGHTGPNNYQNFPENLSASASAGSGTVSGTLNSIPDGDYVIEFFSNVSCDGSGNGEGQTYLGSKTVTVSGGTVSFTSDPLTMNSGDHLTATANDASGNTSEFSQCVTAISPPSPDIAVEEPTGNNLNTGDSDDFGSQEVGTTSAAKTFTIKNTGGSTLTISSVSDDNPTEFVVDQTGMNPTVAPGGNTAFKITFAPNGGQSRSATLQIVSGDPDENPFTLNLSGTGTFPETLVVTKTEDSDNACLPGNCSLREAINAANANEDANTITFAIPANDPGHVYYKDDGAPNQVTPGNVTPTSVTDDASLPDGSGPDPSLKVDDDYKSSWWRIKPLSVLPEINSAVIIDGYTQGTSTPLAASRNTKGLNDPVNGDDAVLRIEIDGEDIDDFVDGFDLFSNDSCTISGLVINHFQGADIYAEDGGGDIFSGNFIGVDVSGTLADGTSATGIYIDSGDGSFIGGEDPGDRNLISGRLGDESAGVVIFADKTSVEGNFIGTDRTGKLEIPNSVGVVIGGNCNFIGCETPDGDNVISGNRDEGILIAFGAGNLVEGNFIGTDNTGQHARPNANGVTLAFGAQYNFIGLPGFPNVISGNGRPNPETESIIGGQGVEITFGSSDNVVQGNLIGLAADGSTELKNLQNGVVVDQSAFYNIIGPVFCDCTENNKPRELKNSGAKANQSTANQVETNQARANRAKATEAKLSETKANQVKARQARANQAKANQAKASQARVNQAKTTPARANQAQASNARSSRTRLTVNDIVTGGNVIAFNGLDGVRIADFDSTNNVITQNSIYLNTGLGINLVSDGDTATNGVTDNDTGQNDQDSGPNNLQNFPKINSASVATGVINFDLDSCDDSPYTVEFFKNPSGCDPSNHGEGQIFLGSTGNLSSGLSQNSDPMTFDYGDVITATAIDVDGNTSEFSVCFTVPGPPSVTVALASPSPVPEDGASNLVFQFSRTDSTGPLTINFSVSGTATFVGAAADYTQSNADTFTSSAGTVTFPDGQKTVEVIVDPTADTNPESDETVTLAVASGTGYTVGSPGTVTGIIGNDDACPTTFFVNSLADDAEASGSVGDGHCDIDLSTDGDQCTLRAAITEANALTGCGTIDIGLSVSGSIDLLSALPAIDHNVNLKGPGANVLTVQRSSASTFRIFNINPSRVVTILDLTIKNGAEATGGGIYNNHGTLTIDGCEITGNAATSEGAGIYNGGIGPGTATLVITNSTISNNNSAVDGGGVDSDSDTGSASLTMTNCTVSGNTAKQNAGGVYVVSSPATLTNVTITDNRADNDSTSGGLGGGLGNSSGTVTLRNTIAAGNFRGGSPSSTRDDINGTLPGLSSHNLIGDGSGMTGISNGDANSNQVGSAGTPIIPYLRKLIYNGGPTRTHGLLYNSPAIDAGDDTVTGPPLNLTKDQRGLPRSDDGDLTAGSHVDIGAYERQMIEERFAPTGTTISVDINDVELTFPSVTNVQPQTVRLIVNPVPNDAPQGSGPAFDIAPTSNFYGTPVTMCFYLPAITNLTTFNTVKIYHREGGVLVEHAETRDFGSKTVCINDITSFSQFVVNQPVTPTAANGSVSGQILDNNGAPVEGAAVRMSGAQNRLTITDAEGNYHFDNVETNGFYAVTPSRANFRFSPAQRSFSQLGAHTDAVFTGTANGTAVNPLDATEYFVRQQYLDFLGREPDESGFNFWVNNIESCGNDLACREVKRVDTSAAFFLSIEFQQTGYLVYRAYEAAYGDLDSAPVPLTLREFNPDTRKISNGVVVLQSGWQQKLETNKQAFMNEFVQRPRFMAAYPTSMTPAQFVDKLFTTAHVESTDPDYAASAALFGAATDTSDVATRTQVLRRLAENSSLTRRQFNRAFVLMEYFGYLRRDPNSGRDADFNGYSFWLDKLDAFNGNFQNAEMVKAFLSSSEYRGRFPQ